MNQHRSRILGYLSGMLSAAIVDKLSWLNTDKVGDKLSHTARDEANREAHTIVTILDGLAKGEKAATPTVSYVAQLPVLPRGLNLRHGPLLVLVERDGDGLWTARLPTARLYATSTVCDADAMDALGERIAEFILEHRLQFVCAELGGTLLKQCHNLNGLIDIYGSIPR